MAVEDPRPADRMLSPGARMSTQLPPLEKLVVESPSSVAPTATTDAARAGLTVHASAPQIGDVPMLSISRMGVQQSQGEKPRPFLLLVRNRA